MHRQIAEWRGRRETERREQAEGKKLKGSPGIESVCWVVRQEGAVREVQG